MFAAKGASLLMPSLTKKRSQLPGAEVTASRKLSSVCIHVERVIQRLQLLGCFRLCYLLALLIGNDAYATIDKMVVVCSGLVNLQTPIINGNDNSNSEHV